MKLSDAPAFADLFNKNMAYYRAEASEFLRTMYWDALQSYDLDQIKRAFNTHAADPEHGRFAPKLADLARVLQGTVGDRAAMAWGKVHDAMRLIGAWQDVVFDDPAIHAAIDDAGGWPKLCRTEIAELGYVQTAFCKAHRAYTGRGIFPYPSLCRGERSPDWEYEKKGLPIPAPVLIGDPQRAAQVMKGGEATAKTAISFQSVHALLPQPLSTASRRLSTTAANDPSTRRAAGSR